MSALPVSADEQYRGPQADALDDERHLASKHVDVSTCRLELREISEGKPIGDNRVGDRNGHGYD